MKTSRSNIISNVISLTSGDLLSQFLSVIAIILTTRALGVEKIGQYIACFSLIRLTAFIFDLGLNNWILREGARLDVSIGELIGSNILLKTLLFIPWFIIIELISLLLNDSTYPPFLLRIASISFWFENIFFTLLIYFKVTLNNKLTAFFSINSGLLLVIFTIFLYSNNYSDPFIYILSRLFVYLICILISLPWIMRKIKLSYSKSVLLSMLKNSFSYASSSILYTVYGQADITIIAVVLGNDMVGIYGPISKILGYLFSIPRSINGVILPLLSHYWKKDKEEFLRITRNSLYLLTFIGALIWLFSGLLGEFLIPQIFGKDFYLSVSIFNILIPIVMLKAGSYTLASSLIAFDWQTRRVIIQTIVAIANILINLLIIVKLGIVGVAWTYVASETILLLGYLWLVEKKRKKLNIANQFSS